MKHQLHISAFGGVLFKRFCQKAFGARYSIAARSRRLRSDTTNERILYVFEWKKKVFGLRFGNSWKLIEKITFVMVDV